MEDNNTTDVLKSLQSSYLAGNYGDVKTKLLESKAYLDMGLFHYNFGTTLLKEGSMGAGRYHLEMALKKGFDHGVVKHNIDYIKETLEPSDLASSDYFSDNLLFYSFGVTPGFYVTLSLFFIFLSLILRKMKVIKNKYIVALFLIISTAPYFYSSRYLAKFDLAVNFKEISIYEGPSKIFPEKNKLKEASRVIVGKRQDGWFLIKSPIYLSGWVEGKELGIY